MSEYLVSPERHPLFIAGDSLKVLSDFRAACIDCVLTAPPVWGQRTTTVGFGHEENWEWYIENLLGVFREVKRVLKPTGSFWLVLGDTYHKKTLLGLPWRVALALLDRQGWLLRNSIIWNKVKSGPDHLKDKLRNVHENVFHFVKSSDYFYETDAIRTKPGEARVIGDAVVTATGVSGVRYRRQIEHSTSLDDDEKRAAVAALDAILNEVRTGKLADFRMVMRDKQATHSNGELKSGRVRDLQVKGFHFLRFHPNGAKPSDVWDILPEDSTKQSLHPTAFPEDLCKVPILATCPEDGIVLDPFAGTGTTNLVAFRFGRKSVGIELEDECIRIASERCRLLL